MWWFADGMWLVCCGFLGGFEVRFADYFWGFAAPFGVFRVQMIHATYRCGRLNGDRDGYLRLLEAYWLSKAPHALCPN